VNKLRKEGESKVLCSAALRKDPEKGS